MWNYFIRLWFWSVLCLSASALYALEPTLVVTDTTSQTTLRSGATLEFGTTHTRTPVKREVQLSNAGDALLTLGAPTLPNGYSLLSPFPSQLAASASSNLMLQLDAATPTSAHSSKLTFTTNDTKATLFELLLHGQVNSAPQINVKNEAIPIPNGMLSGIDFGSTTVGQALNKTFTITNSGEEMLVLSNLKVPHGFSATKPFDAQVAPNGSTTLSVQMDATTTGIYSGLIQFDTNNADETPYLFRVIGTVAILGHSSVQFASSELNVTENVGAVRVILTRAINSQGEVSVTYTTQDGSAIAGQDYTLTTSQVTWADGDFSHKIIEIPINGNDAAGEPIEDFTVVLSNPVGTVMIGARHTLKVGITDSATVGSGRLQFGTTQYVVNESDGQAQLVVERQEGSNNQVSIDYHTQDGSALANTDYTPQSVTLTWAAGDNHPKVFNIPLVNDGTAEPTKQFTVLLNNPQGGATVGVNTQATITLLDSLSTPSTTLNTMRFVQSAYTTSANSGNAAIQVQRVNGSVGEVSVRYTTQDGSAQAGVDFVASQNTLTWANGDVSNKVINIPLRNNPTATQARTFSVILSQASSNASVGTPALATVTLKNTTHNPDPGNNPALKPGFLQFDTPNKQVGENQGEVRLTVSRTDGSDGVVKVNYATQEGTGLENNAYRAVSGELTWAAGDTSDKTIRVNLLDDALPEPNQDFKVVLSNPTNGAQLGTNSEMRIQILDNDATSLRFNNTDQVVREDAGFVTLSVAREGGNIGQVSVSYRTEDGMRAGDAKAGSDYEENQGVLTWQSGDTHSKTILVKILDDTLEEYNQRFNVVLFDPSEGVFLNEPTSLSITIQDNDPVPCQIDTTAIPHVINCTYLNQGHIENVIIGQNGTVIGGTLGGDIQNNGIIENPLFRPNAKIAGGIVKGTIRTDTQNMTANDTLAVINNATIPAPSQVENIIIGFNTKLDSQVALTPVVLFESNGAIPSHVDLTPLLGFIETDNDMDAQAVNLGTDVWLHGHERGLLGTIQGLFDVANQDLIVSQDSGTGYLRMVSEDWLYTLLPVKVEQILQQQVNESLRLGIHLHNNGTVQFVTHLGREIIAQPVVQSFSALRESLYALGLAGALPNSHGNLVIPTANGHYYMARANLFSTTVTEAVTTPLLSNHPSPLRPGTIEVTLTYTDNQGIVRRQILYPAPAFPETLRNLAGNSQTELWQNGVARIPVGNGTHLKTYTGVLDYLVRPGTSAGNTTASFLAIPDVNGDGLDDYDIIYPSGDRQYLFRLP